jgi:heterotetrameric sarcosine oxidase gamma subunit
MSKYNPIFRSPIAVPAASIQATFDVGLSDLTGVQVTLIQGESGDILQQHFATIPNQPGDLVEVGQGLLAGLAPQEFYLFGLSSEANLPSASELDNSFVQAERFARATDLTHGRAVLKLSGPAAAEALGKVCGLDFHDSIFPTMQVKQTSAAKIKTFIARRDVDGTPVYHLHVNRPFGQYFWDIVWDAGQEFGIVAGH